MVAPKTIGGKRKRSQKDLRPETDVPADRDVEHDGRSDEPDDEEADTKRQGCAGYLFIYFLGKALLTLQDDSAASLELPHAG